MFPTTAQVDNRGLARRILRFLGIRQLSHCTSIRIRADGGLVLVEGEVNSERDRWLCIQCCEHVAGVVKVVDKLRVTKRHRHHSYHNKRIDSAHGSRLRVVAR